MEGRAPHDLQITCATPGEFVALRVPGHPQLKIYTNVGQARQQTLLKVHEEKESAKMEVELRVNRHGDGEDLLRVTGGAEAAREHKDEDSDELSERLSHELLLILLVGIAHIAKSQLEW